MAETSGAGRRRAVVTGAAALLAGALLTLWALVPEREGRGRSWAEHVRSQPRLLDRDQAGGKPSSSDVSGPALDAGTAKTSRPLVVRVEDARDETPISEASVVLFPRDARPPGIPFVIPAWLAAEAVTGEEGQCDLDLPDGAGPYLLICSARAYLPRELSLPERRVESLVVRLERGMVMTGRVVDRKGKPVAAVKVIATPGGLPDNAYEIKVRGGERLRWAAAETDTEGRFRLTGLAPGLFRLALDANGWLWAPETDPWHRAGEENMSLIALPIRAFRIRLVEKESRLPVVPAFVAVSVTVGGNTETISHLLEASRRERFPLGDGMWLEAGSEDVSEGTITGYVVVDHAGGAATRSARVDLNSGLFRPCTADITLRLPGSLRTNPMADEIPITFRDPWTGGAGTIEVRAPRPQPYSKWHRMLAWCSVAFLRGREGNVVRGVRLDPDTWRFRGVPPGAWQIRVFDGLSISQPTDVVVEPNAVVRVEVTMPGPQGILLDVRDGKGRRLYDFSLGVDPSGQQGWIGNRQVSRLRLVDGQPDPAFHYLGPGAYKISIGKRGYEPFVASFSLGRGELKTIEATLDEKP